MIEMDQAELPGIFCGERSKKMKERDRIRPARTGHKDLLARVEKSFLPEVCFKARKKFLCGLSHAFP